MGRGRCGWWWHCDIDDAEEMEGKFSNILVVDLDDGKLVGGEDVFINEVRRRLCAAGFNIWLGFKDAERLSISSLDVALAKRECSKRKRCNFCCWCSCCCRDDSEIRLYSSYGGLGRKGSKSS